MNNRYEILKKLLESFDEYDNSVEDPAQLTLEGFMEFVNNPGHVSTGMRRKLSGSSQPDVSSRGESRENSIVILITYLYRYAKLYMKKALQNAAIQSPDEFSFLIILLTHDSLSKTELINMNVHEKTTGMEIIKRLIRMGLVTQFDDDVDKRSQRVSITEQGKYTIFSILDSMGDVSKIVAGNLTELEKHTLTQILDKLDHFHFDIFMNDRAADLKTIIESKKIT